MQVSLESRYTEGVIAIIFTDTVTDRIMLSCYTFITKYLNMYIYFLTCQIL